MKAAIVSLAAIFLIGAGAGVSLAEEPTPAEQAASRAAAQAWLGLIDAGKVEESWSQAAALFRARVSQAQWTNAVTGVRDSLGPLKSRTLDSATVLHTLPGAPDGTYVVIKYSSSFANKASATETVTPMLEADGSWRVLGYLVR